MTDDVTPRDMTDDVTPRDMTLYNVIQGIHISNLKLQ